MITLLFLVCGTFIFYSRQNSEKTCMSVPKKYTFLILAAVGFILRIIAACYYPGHKTDMACFNGWADMLFKDGFSAFYESDVFTDYPPGYMYILYVLGFFKSIFKTSPYAANILLKLPAIISDICCGYIVCKICKKSHLKNLLAGFFIFNPTVIFNSAVWGQVDSVFTLIVLLMLYMLNEKRSIPAYFLFAAAIFIKPQALFYAPVLLFGIIEQIFIDGFDKKKFTKNLIFGLGAIVFLVVLALPFGLGNVVKQYIGTINSYNYASVNAYNFWCALGFNWKELTPPVSIFGMISILITVAVSAYIFFIKKPENRYFYVSAFICFCVFMLSVKMHERYAFPIIALLLCALAINSTKKDFMFFMAISALQFINTAHILFYYATGEPYAIKFETLAVLVSWVTVIVFVLFLLHSLDIKLPKKVFSQKNETETLYPIVKKDIIAICIITVVYAAIALYNLGDTSSPKTYEVLDENTTLSVDFGESYDIEGIKYFVGADPIENEEKVTFTLKDGENNIVYSSETDKKSVFAWYEIKDIFKNARYLDISASGSVYLNEVGIIANGGRVLTPDTTLKIFDEFREVPSEISYRNSMYFDEIYHARTAYEFIHKRPVYEWTHPPLGKVLISAGVKIFGMTPFGWRIVGTLFGILMIPLIYIFSKKMFGLTWISVCTSIIFSYDFMHFAQTRIATIDVYITFFIICMYLMMYLYYASDITSLSFSKIAIILGLCGASMGLGIASKWTGVYAGAGLAVLFFIKFIENYGIKFYSKKNAIKTIVFCFLAFVAIPVLIYALSYIPYLIAQGGGIKAIIQNQTDMLTYHGKTVIASTHHFSSPWYEWLINYRPIWYYTGETVSELSENISAFGNPFVWTGGLFAFIYCAFDACINKNKKAIFLVTGYLAQLLPWIFVTRITFIYHYFPSVPFLVLMIAHFVSRSYQNNKNAKTWFVAFTAVVVLAFIAFYPALSGFPVDGNYVRNFLRWLPSWQLIG